MYKYNKINLPYHYFQSSIGWWNTALSDTNRLSPLLLPPSSASSIHGQPNSKPHHTKWTSDLCYLWRALWWQHSSGQVSYMPSYILLWMPFQTCKWTSQPCHHSMPQLPLCLESVFQCLKTVLWCFNEQDWLYFASTPSITPHPTPTHHPSIFK